MDQDRAVDRDGGSPTETGLKRLDQRLRDRQFYTRSLIESHIDALWTTDPSGIITDVNSQMEALTGSTRDKLIGAPFESCFTEPEQAQAGIALALRDMRVTNYPLTARAADGRTTAVSFNAITFYDRDRALQGVLATARSEPQQRRFDPKSREAQAAEQRTRAVEEEANPAGTDTRLEMVDARVLESLEQAQQRGKRRAL